MLKRDINVDLSRVAATLFVIVLHVLGQGGILQNSTPDWAGYWLGWFLEICAYCAVNCFALISGYVMVDKKTKLRNIISLWLQGLFYSLLINFTFFVFVPETRTINNLIFSFFPIMKKQWWYLSAYFLMFIFIPILNAAINNISKETFKKILFAILFMICVVDCIISSEPFVLGSGYSAIWLMIVYLFGAYIKKYGLKRKITATKSLIGFVLVNIITFLSKAGIYFVSKTSGGLSGFENVLISYISITVLLSAVFLFLFCLNIKINKFFEKAISIFAPTTLSIYLIHVNPFVFEYIIKDAFVPFVHKSAPVMLVCVLIATLVIFLVCAVIDLIRIQIFKLIRVRKISEFIESKITYIYSKYLTKNTVTY